MGTIRPSMGTIPLKRMLVNDVAISSGTLRLSKPGRWLRTFTRCSQTKGMILPLMLTGFYDADLRNSL